MPWKIQKSGDKFDVVKESTGKTVGRGLSKARAAAMLRALYANEPTMNGYPLYGSKVCPNCGQRIPRMAKECPNCGYKTKGTYSRNMKATTRNMINNAIMPRKALAAKMKGTCPKCGGKLAGGKCKGCGMTMNVWSEAARAAAKEKRAGRHAAIHELLTKKKFKKSYEGRYGTEYKKKIQANKMYPHMVSVDKETGRWSYQQGGKRGGGTGHRSLAAHLKSVGVK